MIAVLFLIGGLALLVFAGDRLVTAASRIALRLGLPAVVIGATVVAFGTSMPEFTVSLISTIQDSSGVAVGNVVGSNIVNVLMVLGAAAAIAPVAVHRRLLRFDIPIVIAVTAWALLILADGVVSRLEGFVSVLALLAFTGAQLKWFGSEDVPEELEDLEQPAGAAAGAAVDLGILAVAIAGLAGGSYLFVEGATDIAERLGVSEFAIGATVVAIGTSLPELVTSAIAAFRKEGDIAIGNIVGSNLFNVLGVLGGAAAITPIAIGTDLYEFEMPVLTITAVVLLPLVWRRNQIGRIEGALLLAGFVAFTAITLLRGGS